MATKIHFISGLPRSGSTLLGAILSQNPRFHAGMSSPVSGLMAACIDMMSAGREAARMVTEEQRRSIVKGVFDGYYRPIQGKEVIFDTNRSWTSKLPLVSELFPDAKVIACVRDVPWIMDSIERLVRRNVFEHSRLFASPSDRATVYSRTEALARPDRLVGAAWAALKEAYYGEQASRLLVVEYEFLVRAPEKVMPLIYDFIGEPWFEGHDFRNVVFSADGYDETLGLQGMHTVRPNVAFEPRRTLLPPDLFKRYDGMAFWRDPSGSAAHLITTSPPADRRIE